MLRCTELTERGMDTYSLPFEPETARRLHQDRHHISKVVRYETTQVRFPELSAALSLKCSFAGPVTYVVDGRRVQSASLREGPRIELGNTRMLVRSPVSDV